MNPQIAFRCFCSAVIGLLLAAKPLSAQDAPKPLHPQVQAQDDAPMFTAVDLGNIYVKGINNKGQVVGADKRGSCLWSNGKIVHLPAPPHSLNGWAAAINDAGDIIGTVDTPNASAPNSNHAVLWHNGKLRDLTKEAGFSWGLGVAINNRGEAVGKAGNYDVFVFAENKVRVLPRPAGDAIAEPVGLNDRGEVLGTSLAVQGDAVHVWSSDRLTTLGSFGKPNAINNKGDIVGYTFHWSTQPTSGILSRTPYLYSGGAVHNFDVTATGTSPYVIGINDAGQVAGDTGLTPATPSGMFLWHNGKMYDLGKLIKNLPDWYLSFRAINNQGQILVEGLEHIAPKDFINRKHHAFLLTPVAHKL